MRYYAPFLKQITCSGIIFYSYKNSKQIRLALQDMAFVIN